MKYYLEPFSWCFLSSGFNELLIIYNLELIKDLQGSTTLSQKNLLYYLLSEEFKQICIFLTLAPSKGKSSRLCFLISTGSEPILLCLPFTFELAVIPGFGEPSPRSRHPTDWLVPNISRGHQASRGIGWSLEGTLSTGCKWRLSLLSGGIGGGRSGGGGGGSLKGGGGAGSGLSCFLTMQGED